MAKARLSLQTQTNVMTKIMTRVLPRVSGARPTQRRRWTLPRCPDTHTRTKQKGSNQQRRQARKESPDNKLVENKSCLRKHIDSIESNCCGID